MPALKSVIIITAKPLGSSSTNDQHEINSETSTDAKGTNINTNQRFSAAVADLKWSFDEVMPRRRMRQQSICPY